MSETTIIWGCARLLCKIKIVKKINLEIVFLEFLTKKKIHFLCHDVLHNFQDREKLLLSFPRDNFVKPWCNDYLDIVEMQLTIVCYKSNSYGGMLLTMFPVKK